MGFIKDLFGPRFPCDLCQLGKATWPYQRSGAADWKLRGEGLHADLFICAACRGFLMETGLREKNPMVALAYIVAGGFADRPPVHAYLQHPQWRKIWMHMLAKAELSPSDDFAALAAIRPLEEAFMALPFEHEEPEDAPESMTDDQLGVADLAKLFGLAEEYVKKKYAAYLFTLGTMGRKAHWNDEIDDFARKIGALTEEEIQAAHTDLHQAVLNRVKVALVAAGAEPIE